MNGIESLNPQPNKAKEIAASRNPQAIMAALSGQAGVDPYKVLAAVKTQNDQQQMQQAAMGNSALQQAQQMPQTTIAQELIGRMQGGGMQQPQQFASGGLVQEAEDAFSKDPDFVRYIHSLEGGGWDSLTGKEFDPMVLGQVRRRLVNSGKLPAHYEQYQALKGNRPINPDMSQSFEQLQGIQAPRQPVAKTFENMAKYGPTIATDDFLHQNPKGESVFDWGRMAEQGPSQNSIREALKAAMTAQAKPSGPGIRSVQNRFKAKGVEYTAPEFESPETMTPEEIRAAQERISQKDNEEFDAAMSPLAKRRQEIYERQKASRATSFDNAADGILGADIRGRRLGSGLAAMASGARRSQKEARAVAEQQDMAQLQSEELMARARIEAKKGNREAAAKLLAEARNQSLAALGIRNENIKGKTEAQNKTSESGQGADRFNAEYDLKLQEMAQRRDIANAQIAAQRERRDQDDVFALQKLRVTAERAIDADKTVQEMKKQAEMLRTIQPARATEIDQKIEAIRQRYYAEMGVPITLSTQPPASGPGAANRLKFNPATGAIE